jgi:hypothetical protein
MSTRLKQAAVVFVVLVVAAQLVRPERANPPTDPRGAIEAHAEAMSGLVTVLDRSCRDCHSNKTEWRWYAQVAPLSWVWARAVAEGRNAVNFSEWAAYTPEQQQTLLAASCQDASEGKMPGGAYTLLRSDARLSEGDIQTICAAAHHAVVAASAGRSPTQ